jgi:hypothetical protein
MSSIQSFTLPSSYAVRRMREDDFALDTRDKICIFDDNCTLILFYNESQESKKMLAVFKTAAEATSGIRFGACNAMLERRVAEALTELNVMKDHPFSWCTGRPFPFVLVYRRGYPVNFYDGPVDYISLSTFAMTIACMTDFHSRNFKLIDKVKQDMWNAYRERNPELEEFPTERREITLSSFRY